MEAPASISHYQGSLGPISVSLAAGTVSGGASIGTDTLRSIEYVFGTNASDTYDASNFSRHEHQCRQHRHV